MPSPLARKLFTKDGKPVDNNNPLPVQTQAQVTAFNELSIAEPSPIVQVHFPYNINADIIKTRNNKGTTTIVNNKAHMATGAGANQSASILTMTPVKYNPGQGGMVRFTALYTAGVADSTQWVGIGNSTDGYFFGFNGTDFGILRRQGGLPEVRRLTITTKSTDADSITITLNGQTKAVTVTDATATDVTTTANEIAAADFSDVGEGWEVHAMGDKLFFTSFSTGSKTGTYSLTDATSAVGTFTQSISGTAANETFTAQTSWNKDLMDGTGGSGITLDPTKGNVYQIRYQWLGFGDIDYFITSAISSTPILIHRIEYANANTIASLDNPTLPLCGIAKNTSNTTDIALEIGSMGGFVEGRDTLPGLPHSVSVEAGGIGTTETPVLTIHSHDIYQSEINRVKIKLKRGSISVDGTKPVTIRVRKNAVLTGGSFSALDSNTSTIHFDTSATVVTGGTVIFSSGVSKDGSVEIPFDVLGIEMNSPDFLTISIEASTGNTDTIATLSWQELF